MTDNTNHDHEVNIVFSHALERCYQKERQLDEIWKKNYTEGRIEAGIESLKDFLSELGTIPEDITTRIDSETNLDTLRRWVKLAAKSKSIEEFVQKMS